MVLKRAFRSLNHYRVVTDRYCGYTAEVWRPLWPFWCEIGFCNTSTSIAKAEDICREHASGGIVAKYLGRWTGIYTPKNEPEVPKKERTWA